METKPGAAADSDSPPLVLVVDDNRANAQVLSDFLEAIGYRARIAHSGTEGLALVDGLRPACVLMDIQMPGMDGLQAIRAIRETSQVPRVPIIAVTALAMSGDSARCLEAGADAYLSKPLTLAEVSECLQRLLASTAHD